MTIQDAAMKESLGNGKFELRALVNKNRPNTTFVPTGIPKALTQGQLDILKCWVDVGFPGNLKGFILGGVFIK